MNELENVLEAYDIDCQDVGNGFTLTRVVHPDGFSSTIRSGGNYQGQALISVGHPPCYFLLNQHGEINKILREDAGWHPTFFYSPDDSPWVCLTVYCPDKERENVFPLFCRHSYTSPKPKKEGSLGDYVGNIGNELYFVRSTADKIQQIRWEKGGPGKVSNIKFPNAYEYSTCHIFDHALHLIQVKAKEDFDLLDYLNGLKPKEAMPVELTVQHALLNAQGEICQQRELAFSGMADHVYAHHLSFTQTSTFLTLDMVGCIRWVEITSDGQAKETVLHCIHDDFYSITGSVRLCADTFLLTYTTASGNGWLIVRAGQLQACYIGKGCVYKDAVSGHEIQMPFQGKTIIGACSKTITNGYCIGFYEGNDAPGVRGVAICFLNQVV